MCPNPKICVGDNNCDEINLRCLKFKLYNGRFRSLGSLLCPLIRSRIKWYLIGERSISRNSTPHKILPKHNQCWFCLRVYFSLKLNAAVKKPKLFALSRFIKRYVKLHFDKFFVATLLMQCRKITAASIREKGFIWLFQPINCLLKSRNICTCFSGCG